MTLLRLLERARLLENKSTRRAFGFENLIAYWNSVCFLFAVSLAAKGLEAFIGYRAVGFIFLLAVLIVGFLARLGPVLFVATVSWLVWNFFFIPPKYTVTIGATEDLLMCATYFFVAVATGLLANRVKNQEEIIRIREERTHLLYEVLLDMTTTQNNDDFLIKITDRLGRLFKAECQVFVKSNATDSLVPIGLGSSRINSEELTKISELVGSGDPGFFRNPALPETGLAYFSIRGNHEFIGLFRLKTNRNESLSHDQTNLLQSVSRQIGITLEKQIIEQRLRETERLEHSERIHETLLNSISHELRTPLTVIIGAASALERESSAKDEPSRRLMTKELRRAGERLNRVVENLLDMSRLNAGGIAIKLEWHDLSDLVGVVVTGLEDSFDDRRIEIKLLPELPLVKMDFRLVEHALCNVLINALTYTPAGSKIEISTDLQDDSITVIVEDNGPGIPPENLQKIFDKFFRLPGSKPGGTGLGLSIVKSILEFHHGSVTVRNRATGGARFELRLPLRDRPSMPAEFRG